MASITCGNCKFTHRSIRAVKLCYDVSQTVGHVPAAPGHAVLSYPGFEVVTIDDYLSELDAQEAEQRGEIEAELAVERYFEDRGWDDARWEEDRLSRIPF